MPCRLCTHRDNCRVYGKLKELEDVLRDSTILMDYALTMTILLNLEEEITKKCRDYEEVKL